jgi:hypothetical protein
MTCEPLIGADRAAELLHVHPKTVKRLAARGRDPRNADRWQGLALPRISSRRLDKATTTIVRPPASGEWRTMRTRFQVGSVELSKRKNRPDQWQCRWRERIGGKVVRRAVILGTIDDYPTESLALIGAKQWRPGANNAAPRSVQVTFGAVLDRYERGAITGSHFHSVVLSALDQQLH